MAATQHCLSFFAGFSVIGLCFILLSLVTENWVEYQVDRRQILNAFNREPELNLKLKEAFNKNPNYFTRNQGLFFACFPDILPSESGTFMKPVTQAHCLQSYSYFPAEQVQESFTQDQTTHLWVVRAVALLFILGLVFGLFCLLIGCAGCWTRSPKILGWTFVFSLLSGATCFFLSTVIVVMLMAAAIGCWHVTQHYELEKLDVAPYYQSWEPVLKSTTRSHFAYGYALGWAGISFLGIATIFLFFGRKKIKEEEEQELCAKQGYIMPSYFDQKAMVPYGYNTYGGYGAYPYYNQYNSGGYYGYMTYGR